MKIAILTQYYPPEIGAPQARLSELAVRFAERGHEVSVLTAMPNYPGGRIHPGYSGLWRRESNGRIKVIRTAIYPTKRLGVRRLACYFSFVVSSLLCGSFLLPRVDVLISESPPLFIGIAAYLLSRIKRARWVFNVSDLWPESAVRLGAVSQGWSLRLAYALEAFCYRKSWLVTGQSSEIMADIQSRFPGCATWRISNGVTPELFTPEARTPEARQLLGEGETIALYAGLHGFAQGLDQVLEAAALLRDLHGLRIVFLGDGPEKTRLMQAAKQRSLTNVSFLAPVPRADVPALLASADIVLAPLKSYLPGAVPSKIYEAMAVGLPVVLTGEGEAAEIVRRTHSGLVTKPGDGAQLASAIRELASNESLRRELGESGRRAALSDFNRRNILARFIDHLERNIAGARSAGNENSRLTSTSAAPRQAL